MEVEATLYLLPSDSSMVVFHITKEQNLNENITSAAYYIPYNMLHLLYLNENITSVDHLLISCPYGWLVWYEMDHQINVKDGWKRVFVKECFIN